MAGNWSAWREKKVDTSHNTQSDGKDLASGKKESDEEKKKKKKATVTYNSDGTVSVTGASSREEALAAYREDRDRTREQDRQDYKNAIRQNQLKTGKTVDSGNAVTAADRMWNRGSNAPKQDAYSETTKKLVAARRNTEQKKKELEDYDNQEFDWTDANARKAHMEGRKEKEAAVSQAEQEQNTATMESGLDRISRLSEEGQKKLDEYNYRKDTASDPLATGLPALEQWFAENEHLDKDSLEKLAEVRRRDTNAKKAAEKQQAAQKAADEHPVWNSALTVPANMVGGAMASFGYLGEMLNGTGQFTDLDPYNQGTQLQNWSGAVRGEVKQNIVGDGSNPLRAIAGGAYGAGMGLADTGAQLALGSVTGGGSWVGAGISAANTFGSSMQSAASRGATMEQALAYASASAAVDALTEKIPLDNLISVSKAKGGAGYILNFLRSAGIEATQEEASQLASVFTDAGIMKDKSERNLEVAQMMTMNPDMSLEEAQAIVDRGIVNDLLYSGAVAAASGGTGGLFATARYNRTHKAGDTDTQTANAQTAQEAAEAEALDSAKAQQTQTAREPLDGEQMARALAGQEQPAGAADALEAARAQAEAERAAQTQAPTESEAAFDQVFDRVMNQESQTPETQTEAQKTDVDAEMGRRARMALGMEDGQGSAEPAAATSQKPQEIPAAQPEARQEQPAAQNAQQQPQTQNTQPVQQQPQAQATQQAIPQETQSAPQSGETGGKVNGQENYIPGAQANAEADRDIAGTPERNFSGKAEYENLLTDENTQRDRPGDVRPVEVPKTDADGKRITEFAGNAYGAQATPDRMASEIETLVQDGSLSFDTRTNQQSLEQAADYIGKRGADVVRGEITARANSGKMNDGDIEKAMLLYTRYANDDSPQSQEAASEMMVALSGMANKTGRNLQMFGMMRKMTPEGQLMTVEKTVEQNVKRLQQLGRVKKDYVSDGVDAELKADYLKAAKKAKKATDPETQKAAAKEMRAAEDAIYKAEAAKMPATFAAQWNAWRYMSMMGNVRTNVRNVGGNAAFVPYKVAKDKLGALVEKVLLPKDQRTKSLVQDADLLAWAKEDTKTDLVQDALQYTGLLGDDASTQKLAKGQRVFKKDMWEGFRKLSEAIPAKGDALFKNSYYARNLAGFLKARGISVADITSGNVDQRIMTEGRNYAINEAMKATFNDANALSDFISNMGRSPDSNPVAKAANIMLEGVLPFRRTPANIIVRFKDYSPIGMLQGVWDAAKNVKAGKITAAGAIDEICAGLTGTGAMAIGYTLAKGFGGVKLTGSDVDEDEQRQGHQQYALEFSVGGQEYSYKIDWAAPANLPLFVGANIAQMLEDEGQDADISAFSSFLTAGKGMFEPMLELSMLSSLNDLISGVKYSDGNPLYKIASGMATSYLTQAIPALLRQADTAIQKYARTTYANSAGPNIRELQRTAANLPFIGQVVKTDKVDAWGEKVDNGSIAVRAFNAFVNPGTIKKIQESPLEQEISRLNGAQESNVSPDSVPRVVSYTDEDGEYIEDLRLTDEQYEKWATAQGQTARRIQDGLVKNAAYQNLSDKQKAEALNLAKEYATEQGKRAALAGYPEAGESWMVGIDGKEAAAIVDKVTAGTLENAIGGLAEAMKNGWSTGNREKTLEEGYAAYEKMDAQTKARVGESVSGDTARYLEARENGVSTTAYLKVLKAVKNADGTGNSAKYRAITSASISDSAMDKLMKAYMPDYDPDNPKSDKTELKYDYARKELGMSPAQYAQAYEIYTSDSDDLHYKKQKMAKWTELYGADVAKQLWKLYKGTFDVADWYEDQQ